MCSGSLNCFSISACVIVSLGHFWNQGSKSRLIVNLTFKSWRRKRYYRSIGKTQSHSARIEDIWGFTSQHLFFKSPMFLIYSFYKGWLMFKKNTVIQCTLNWVTIKKLLLYWSTHVESISGIWCAKNFVLVLIRNLYLLHCSFVYCVCNKPCEKELSELYSDCNSGGWDCAALLGS